MHKKNEKTEKNEKNSSGKNASSAEKNISNDKDVDEKNDRKSNAATTSSNDEDSGRGGGGKSSDDSKTGSGMRLSAGESSFSGESGEKTSKLDEVPVFIARDEVFAAPVFDNDAPASATFSPLKDNDIQKGGAGCTVE